MEWFYKKQPPPPPPPKKIHKLRKGLIDFASGSMGGMMQVYVSQPLDTVKVKQQAFPVLYKNMVSCFMATYRHDGIMKGLYAGTVPAIVANVAENSVLFAAYGGCQQAVAWAHGIKNLDDLKWYDNACAGAMAAVFSTFALCPTELVKCKLQAMRESSKAPADSKEYKTMQKEMTPWKLTKQIVRTDGFAGLFRGLTSTFIREVPGYFFFFGGYEGTREFFAERENVAKDEIGPFKTMVAGAVGGVVLWVTIFPADVIKSRIQVNNVQRGMFDVGREIVRKEGFLALYNGLLPSVLRTIPATATLFVTYEYTKKTLENLWKDED